MAPNKKAKAAKDILQGKPYRVMYIENSTRAHSINECNVIREDKMPYYVPDMNEVVIINNPNGEPVEWMVTGKGYHLEEHAVLIMLQLRVEYEAEWRAVHGKPVVRNAK